MKFAIIKNKKIRYLIIYSSIMDLYIIRRWLGLFSHFQEISFLLSFYGILWAILNFSAGITSYNAYKILFCKNSKLQFIDYLFSYNVDIIYNAWFKYNILGFIFIFIIYFIRGIVTPILRNDNDYSNIELLKRATVLSWKKYNF